MGKDYQLELPPATEPKGDEIHASPHSSIGLARLPGPSGGRNPGPVRSAQSWLGMRGIGLENSDYELIEETVLAAISEDAEIGTETSWRNEETGAVGTVTVKEISKEGRCVSFDLLVRPSHAGDVRAFQSRRCLGADGTWRLSLE